MRHYLRQYPTTVQPNTEIRHADPLMALSDGPPFAPANTTGSRPLDETQQELVTSHLRLAYRFAWRFARHELRGVPADELIAEALFALTCAASRYDPKHNVPFNQYANLVVRHRLIQWGIAWRRRQRQQPWPLDRVIRDLCQPDEPTSDDRPVLEQLRAYLPARWFNILWLHGCQGFTLEEIGLHLGISKQRAQRLLRKAIHRARRYVDHMNQLAF